MNKKIFVQALENACATEIKEIELKKLKERLSEKIRCLQIKIVTHYYISIYIKNDELNNHSNDECLDAFFFLFMYSSALLSKAIYVCSINKFKIKVQST